MKWTREQYIDLMTFGEAPRPIGWLRVNGSPCSRDRAAGSSWTAAASETGSEDRPDRRPRPACHCRHISRSSGFPVDTALRAACTGVVIAWAGLGRGEY